MITGLPAEGVVVARGHAEPLAATRGEAVFSGAISEISRPAPSSCHACSTDARAASVA